MAETCGNTECNSSDPFDKKRRAKKIGRIINLLVIIGGCAAFYYTVGNPLDILRDPGRIFPIK